MTIWGRRLLARTQVAIWGYEEALASPESLEAVPWRVLVADSLYVIFAGITGFGPLLRNPETSNDFLTWVRHG